MSFLKPEDLKKIADDAELEELRERAAKARLTEQAADDLRRAFEARSIDPKTPERINSAIRAAAARGAREVLVLRFPAEFCGDGGRSINNFEADWPSTLRGFGKTAFDYYQSELKPLGFSMRAEIMSFPGGNMGDVGLYLRW